MSDAAAAGKPASLVELIERLIEPTAPDPVSMAPQTAGWAVVAVAAAVAVAWFAWRRWRRWRADAYRRAALAELATAGDDPSAIAAIVRRTALATWPRREVAGLCGTDWLRFLDATGGGGAFSAGPGAALAAAPYERSARSAAGLNALAARWIREHRVDLAGDATASARGSS